MIAVTHSAAISPRSMTSLTAASLASHGVRAPIGGQAGLASTAGRQHGAGGTYLPLPEAHAALALVQHSPPVQAAGTAAGSVAWAAATPGVSIAAAAQAALAAAATPAQPLGLAFSDSEDDSSDDSGLNNEAGDSEVDADDEIIARCGDQLHPLMRSNWQAVHEAHPPAAERGGDGYAPDLDVTAEVPVPAFAPGYGDDIPQPDHMPVHAEPTADSEQSGDASALGDSAVQWVAADVAAQATHAPRNPQYGSGGPTTVFMSGMHSEIGLDDTPAAVTEPQAGSVSERPPATEADTPASVLNRPSRIPRPPSMAQSTVTPTVRGSAGMAALRRSASAATSRAVASQAGCNRHSEGGARGDAAGHQDSAYALEAATVDTVQEGEYSIAAVFSELALVAKMEAAASLVDAQQPEGRSQLASSWAP